MHTIGSSGQAWPRSGWSLPSVCALCGSWGARRLCGACTQRFGQHTKRCQRCALRLSGPGDTCPACLRSAPPYVAAVAAVDYEFPWPALIAALKFRDGLDLAPALATRLAQAVREATLPPVQLVVPVPLGPARLAVRGYNQSWELARRVAADLRLPASPSMLQRWLDTPDQRALGLRARRRNVRGAFGVSDNGAVVGRDIALVDDVTTSGATAAEATLALLRAGAHSVQLWTLARTAPPD